MKKVKVFLNKSIIIIKIIIGLLFVTLVWFGIPIIDSCTNTSNNTEYFDEEDADDCIPKLTPDKMH